MLRKIFLTHAITGKEVKYSNKMDFEQDRETFSINFIWLLGYYLDLSKQIYLSIWIFTYHD